MEYRSKDHKTHHQFLQQLNVFKDDVKCKFPVQQQAKKKGIMVFIVFFLSFPNLVVGDDNIQDNTTGQTRFIDILLVQ